MIYVIDLFCGAGGTTTGINQCRILRKQSTKVIACINHDKNAILSHAANHPECVHFTEDIRTFDISMLMPLLNTIRKQDDQAIICLWASLECTNFSIAKGGKPRDADSRTLAEHLYRYINQIHPDYIMIENVKEFMSWGPLDENGKPISRKNGEDFNRWKNQVCSYGYRYDHRLINAADLGAYTSRLRYFAVFNKPDLPVTWPEQTHAKNPSSSPMFKGLRKWKAVKEVLDLQDKGKSILNRKKPLSEKTLARIYAGLVKFVAGGKEAFLLKYNSMNQDGVHTPPSIDEPCPTIAAQARLGLIQPVFISTYYGNGDNVSSVDSPCPTLSTKDRAAIVQPQFIDNGFTGPSNIGSINSPSGTIMTKDHYSLVSAEPFLVDQNFSNGASSVDDPAKTILACRKHQYIVNPAWGGNNGDVDAPLHTIVARQDKAPLSIVSIENGIVFIHIYEEDSPYLKLIKEFMAMYGIIDIKMRMLKINELLLIQGFPKHYQLIGTQTDQKKFIGNSVHPLVARKWFRALSTELYKRNLLTLAA